MKSKDLKTSVISRSAKLLGMASELARSEFSQNVKAKVLNVANESDALKARVYQAQVLVKSLSQLKGAAMKAGQLLSLDSSDLLPKEVVDVLSQLQSQTEPVDYADIEKIVREQLGDKFERLENFSQKAEAAASIGQVHSAYVDGEKVAVKIQYPDIDKSIDSDVEMLKKIIKSAFIIYGKRIDIEEVMNEMRRVLHQEADYNRELQFLSRYYDFCLNETDYEVPKPFPELSTKYVLTMSWEPGMHLTEWIESNPSMEAKQTIATKLLDLYCKEFYDWGIVQTDPNYGNFLIQPESLKIVILDFGASIEYDDEFRQNYIHLSTTLRDGNEAEIIETAIANGLLDERESELAQQLFVKLMRQSVRPFTERQPFRFADPQFEKAAREVGLELSRELKYSPPPHQIMFLHRKLGGLFNLMRRLEVEIDLEPYWQRMVQAYRPPAQSG